MCLGSSSGSSKSHQTKSQTYPEAANKNLRCVCATYRGFSQGSNQQKPKLGWRRGPSLMLFIPLKFFSCDLCFYQSNRSCAFSYCENEIEILVLKSQTAFNPHKRKRKRAEREFYIFQRNLSRLRGKQISRKG
jgi:hypothetical protein